MNQQVCKKCGSSLPGEAKFCPECGTAVAGATPASEQPSTLARRGSKQRRDLLILVGILLVVTVGYFVFRRPRAVPGNPAADQQMHGDIPMSEMGDMMNVLKDLPTDYGSLVTLGNKQMDQGNYPLAAECYKRALAIEADHVDVQVDYGACLHGMGLPQRAIEEFDRVLKEHPSHALAAFNLGIVYYDLNEFDSARVYLQRSLDIDPDSKAAEGARQLLQDIGS